MALNLFLTRCLAAVKSREAALHFVLGNEGGDMDSVVGSIYLAHLLSTVAGSLHVPLLNFPLMDLPLRNDVATVLRGEHIDTAMLLSVHKDPETDLGRFVDLSRLKVDERIILFDHNKLTSSQSIVAVNVSGIVDHHADEQLYVEQSSPLRVIEKVGSACTLVDELYRQYKVPVPQPHLLLAPIVLDTMNFDPAQKKSTARDEAARDRLLEQCPLPSGVSDFFKVLSGLKFDISSLTVPQTLRRDYKRFDLLLSDTRQIIVGVSSVLLLESDVHQLYTHNLWLDQCTKFKAANSLDLLLVMFAKENTDGAFTRELGVLGSQPLVDILKRFGEATQEEIGLCVARTTAATPHGGCLDELVEVHFSQRDATVSRKGLTPLLSKYLLSSHL